MAPACEGLSEVQRKILLTMVLLLFSSVSALAWKVTIDSTESTGAGNYRTFNEFLDSLTNNKRVLSSSGEDTVLVVGETQLTHTVSKYVASITSGKLRFIGEITVPDEFMILNHTAASWYNLINNVDLAFERFIFTGSAMFETGTTAKRIQFRNCVIASFTSSAGAFIYVRSTGASATIFENCLFHNNQFTRGIVDIQTFGTTPPVIKFLQCTMHANNNVFNCKPDVLTDSIAVKNCIFSANSSIFYSAAEFKDKITYSVVPDETYDGSGNVEAFDPAYIVPSGKINPSDWRVVDSSVARGLGDTAGVPGTDISGRIRSDEPGKRDAGCWDILDAPRFTLQPLPDTVGVGDTVLLTVAVTGAPPLSYTWIRIGTTVEVVASEIDTLKLENVTIADDSTYYFCIAANTVQADTSDTVLIRVFQKPEITDKPDTAYIYAGDTATFSVAALGGALNYSWLCNDSIIPDATEPTLVLPEADSGNIYYCKISNPIDTVQTIEVMLHILPPEVRITSQLDDITLMEGDDLSFTVEAIGKPLLEYTWIKIADGSVIANTNTFEKSAVTLADGGAYRCIVENEETRDSIDVNVTVTAGVAPKINKLSGPFVAVKEGDPVTLWVIASGAEPLSYTWYRKSGTSADSVFNAAEYVIDQAQKADSGDYFCVVSNDKGGDTTDFITLDVSSSPQFNPLKLAASFVDPTHVQIQIDKFRELPAVSETDPFTDTIGIWYNPLTIPSGSFSRTDTNCIKIPLSAMTPIDGDIYDTIVAVPGPGDECGDMHFTVTPLWKNPDTIISQVASIQNAKVYMCDSVILENSMHVEVEYISVTDSIVVSVKNLTTVNRDSLMNLIISYTFPGRQPVKSVFLPDELPPADEDEFLNVFRDVAFTESEETLTVTVRWRGVLGNFSAPVMKKVVVGKPRPINTAQLFADSTTSSTAAIHWEFTGSVDFDSIRVVWGAQPLTPSTIISGTSFETLMLGSSVRSTVLKKLSSEFTYSVGVQVMKDTIYSFLTSASIVSCTTKVDTSGGVENSIDILTASFIPSSNSIELVWTIDPDSSGPVENLITGIVWEVDTTPDYMNIIGRDEALLITDCKDTNTVTIDLGDRLQFSTAYHFAMVLSKKSAASRLWTGPIDSSQVVVNTGEPVWQKVSYFKDDEKIVTVFNGSIILEKVGDGVVSVVDTVLAFHGDSLLDNFIAVGQLGLDFVNDTKSDPIRIGLKYDEANLLGRAPSEIHIYQFNSTESEWSLVEGSVVDTAARKVSVVLSPDEYPEPFMLLIDTLVPAVVIASDTSTPVAPGYEIPDTLHVTDNIANCKVTLRYWGLNGSGGVMAEEVACTSSTSTLVFTVPADSIVMDRGLKAEIIVSDGVFRNVYDVSRRVQRQVSDPIVLSGNKWTPVMTTSQLVSDSIEVALSDLSSGDKWEYNPMNFRMFKWIDTSLAHRQWVEYTPADRSLFSMHPGSVIWVKTRENKEIASLGEGTTVSVKEPFQIVLKSGEWTDMALPFKMDIHLGDIFTVSDPSLQMVNVLQICKWVIDTSSGTITAQPKFIGNIPGFDLSSTVLSSLAEDDGIASYTVFNYDTVDHILKIPPVPESFARYPSQSAGLSKKMVDDGSWSVIIRAQSDGEMLTPVIVGCNRTESGIRNFPPPPGFMKRRVYLEKMGEKNAYGAVLNTPQEEGVSYNLVFENNDKKPATVTYAIPETYNLPEAWNVMYYHPDNDLPAGKGSGPITVGSGSSHYSVFLAGDSAFIASRITTLVPRFSLVSMYPNPCRGVLSMRFSLPPADVKEVKVELYDQLGRIVQKKVYSGSHLRTGQNMVSWKLRNSSHGISAGTYIVRFTVYSSEGNVLGNKLQPMLYLP